MMCQACSDNDRIPTFVLTVRKQLDRYIDFLNCNKPYLHCMDIEPFLALPLDHKEVRRISRERGRKPEEVSNRLSFAAILREARSRGYPGVLILEDDVQFEGDVVTAFRTVRDELPDDFALCTFGTYFRRARVDALRKYSEGLVSIGGKNTLLWGAHAFIFSEKVYDECIRNYEDPGGQITDEYIYKTLIGKYRHKCFVCNPMVAFSRPVIGMHGTFPFEGMYRKTVSIMESVK